MRIAFLLRGHPRRHPIWSVVAGHLAQRGAEVDVRFAAAELTGLSPVRVEHDLYVLKDTSPLGLSLGAALEAAGAMMLNPHAVAALCRDKIRTSHALVEAGVPMPETWVTEDPLRVRETLEDGPVVVKPYLGSRGIGVHVVDSVQGLDELALGDGPVFVQRYHKPDGEGRDHKIYCIDGRVFGVRRVWPSRTRADKLGEPFIPGEELRAIAGRCAAAIGTGTFGFDVVYSRGEPYVVDLSGFPGFKGVPGAERRLAAAVEAAAHRLTQGEPLVTGVAG